MDKLQAALEAIPYGVMLSDPIRDSTGTVVNFWLRAFNQQAQQEAPGLKSWYPGATLFESFPAADQSALFGLYQQVLHSGEAFQARYDSPSLGQAYLVRIERLGPTILALSVPLPAGTVTATLNLNYLKRLRRLVQPAVPALLGATPEPGPVPTLEAFEGLLARYRRAFYEQYQPQ